MKKKGKHKDINGCGSFNNVLRTQNMRCRRTAPRKGAGRR